MTPVREVHRVEKEVHPVIPTTGPLRTYEYLGAPEVVVATPPLHEVLRKHRSLLVPDGVLVEVPKTP